MTKLEAVNEILLRAGGYRVEALDTNGPSAAGVIETMIDSHELKIQSRGWHYNRRSNVELSPDGSGRVAVPANVIQIDPDKDYTSDDLVPINGFLFDLKNNTDVLNKSVKVEYVLRYDFPCIPQPVQWYIVMDTCMDYISHRGDRQRQPAVYREWLESKARAEQYNTDQSDFTALDTAHGRYTRGRKTAFWRRGYI